MTSSSIEKYFITLTILKYWTNTRLVLTFWFWFITWFSWWPSSLFFYTSKFRLWWQLFFMSTFTLAFYFWFWTCFASCRTWIFSSTSTKVIQYDFGPISRANELKHFSGPKSQPRVVHHLIFRTDSKLEHYYRTHQSVAEIELQREYWVVNELLKLKLKWSVQFL